jgi:hypothetical protein
MTNLRLKISRATSKKVPVLALVVVAMLGMVAGVLAANLQVAQTANTGEIGTYHTSSGTMTVTDNGLGVVANTAAASTTGTFPTSGNNVNVNNALTAGHWFDQITFTDTATDATAHTATVTIRNGAGPSGTLLVTATFTITGPGASSTGTITAYVDTTATSLTSPITVYVSIT